jgi:hypothetical protein
MTARSRLMADSLHQFLPAANVKTAGGPVWGGHLETARPIVTTGCVRAVIRGLEK